MQTHHAQTERAPPMDHADPGERLRWARENAGYGSARAAAAAIGEAESTYRAYETGLRRFDADKAKLFARMYQVAPEWLLLGIETAGSPPWGRRIPVIDHTQAAIKDVVNDPYSVSVSREVAIPDASHLSPNAFALDVKYEAMTHDGPDSFKVGETIICDPHAEVKPGDYILAFVEGSEEVVFRKYHLVADGKDQVIQLVPLNKSWPTITIDSDHPGHVVGRIVRQIRAF